MHRRHAAPGEPVWARRPARRRKTHHHLKHIDPEGNHPWVFTEALTLKLKL